MEDGLPSLPVNETLFDDANWAQDIPLPDNEDMDVFSLVETLGLDEDMAMHDVDSLWPVQQGQGEQQHQVHDAQEHQPECQKPVAKRGGQKSTEAQRVERIRARNREAQARYRQKARGQAAELQCSVSTIQSAVTSARERQQNLQDQKVLLQQRCSNSSAALDAIRSVSNLIPATPAVPSHATAGCPETAPGRSRKEPTCAPVEAISPPVTSASTSAGTSLISTKPKRRSTDSIFSSHPVSSIPRPLSSYVHHKSIALSQVGSSAAGQLSRASVDPSGLWDEQELAVTGKLDVRKCVDDFRAAEARSRGCRVSDISWYNQTHVDLGTNLAKAPSSVVGQDTATTGHHLAFSTTFSSGPCIAAFILLYLHLATENSAVIRALDILEGAAPEDIASQLSSCGLDEESSSTDTVFYSKRRRDGTGGSISMPEQSRKTHKGTGEVLASLGLTYKHFDLCHVRCGKDAVLPLRQSVENAFSSTVVRLCGVMPLSLLRRCFEQAIDTIDRMLIGFTKGLRSCPTSSQATPSHSGVSDDSHQASMNGSGTRADTDAQGAGATDHCPCGNFEASKQPSSWEELYTQETNLHAICTMLAVRHQLTAFIDDMQSIVAGSNPTDRLTTRPRLVHHIRQLAEDFCFSEIVCTMDSPKLVFNMIMDAFQPFLGQYYLMDNMHVNLYRKVRPSALQRSLMAEFWLAQANRRRSHDEYIHTARSLLAALPSNVPLPLDFFTHLNNLLASGTPSEGAHSIVISPAGPVPESLAKQLSSVFSRSSITSQAAQNLESCFQRSSTLSMNGSSSALSWNMDTDPAHHQHHSIDSRQYSVLSLSHNSSSVGMSQIPSDQPEVRFMGQHAEDMVRAEMALRELRTVQDAARDLQADVLNADMPGVLLQVDKQTRIWADHFMSQMMPPDFLELCQMAASQQNRFSLFEHPFK